MDYKSLPQKIQDWLGSDTLTYLMMDLSDRFHLKPEQESVIPIAIFNLATGKIKPQDFKKSVAEGLNLSPETLVAAIRMAKERALKPIQFSLMRDVGIDIDLIDTGGEARSPMPPPNPAPGQAIPGRLPPIDLRNKGTATESRPAPRTDDQPFILHRENPDLGPFTQKVGAPRPPSSEKNPEEPKRVVHYSGPVTRLE